MRDLSDPFWTKARGHYEGQVHAWVRTGSLCGAYRTPPTQADVANASSLRPRIDACSNCVRAAIAYKANKEAATMPQDDTPQASPVTAKIGPDFYGGGASETPIALTRPDIQPPAPSVIIRTAQDIDLSPRPTPTFQASTRQALLEFPGRIRRARREEWELRTQIDRLNLEAKLEEAKVAGAVARETKEDGKPRFSNQDARDAETRARLVEHTPIRELRHQIDEARRRLAAIEASIECWTSMTRNARVLELASSKAAAVFDLGEDGI